MKHEMRTAYLGLIPKVYALATATDEGQRNALDKTVKEEIGRLVDRINAYSERITDAKDKAVLDEAKMALVSFVGKLRQISSLAGIGESQMALEVIQRDVDPLHQQLSNDFDRLVANHIGDVKDDAATGEATLQRRCW